MKRKNIVQLEPLGITPRARLPSKMTILTRPSTYTTSIDVPQTLNQQGAGFFSDAYKSIKKYVPTLVKGFKNAQQNKSVTNAVSTARKYVGNNKALDFIQKGADLSGTGPNNGMVVIMKKPRKKKKPLITKK